MRRWTVTELGFLTEEAVLAENLAHSAGRCACNREEKGSMVPTGSEEKALTHFNELLQSCSLYDTTDDSTTEVRRLGLVNSSAEESDAVTEVRGGTTIGKQFDVRVWEIIQKEVMDWWEPGQVPSSRGCKMVRASTSYYCCSSIFTCYAH